MASSLLSSCSSSLSSPTSAPSLASSPLFMMPSTHVTRPQSPIPVIDVEYEAERREYHAKIIRENHIFIPEQYYARMCQSGMAEQLTKITLDIKAKRTALIRETFFGKRKRDDNDDEVDDGIYSPPHHKRSFYRPI
jgi:hypothetical protein